MRKIKTLQKKAFKQYVGVNLLGVLKLKSSY